MNNTSVNWTSSPDELTEAIIKDIINRSIQMIVGVRVDNFCKGSSMKSTLRYSLEVSEYQESSDLTDMANCHF